MTASSQIARRASGGLIDRAKPLDFTFDGHTYTGFAGDTLASALIANGVSLVGRSFKYHRRRGILTAGSEEPNALVELRTGSQREPNTKATTVELYDGLAATSQNRWPSLAVDLLSINGLLSPVFSAGFYYKTFMWPAAFWEKLYEPMIRRAAGLGTAAPDADPDRYDKAHAFTDVLVIGAGPAGLMAALTAARSGARVILADENFVLGGRLLSEMRRVSDKPAPDWAASTAAELASMPSVRIMPRTTVFGLYDGGTYGAIERNTDHLLSPPPGAPRQTLWNIVAKRAIIAQGATERPIAFGNNDLPGVMLAGAVRTYVNRFAVKPGTRAVMFTNNDDGASVIHDLAGAGIEVAAWVDTRRTVPGSMKDEVARLGTRIFEGAAITDAVGHSRVRAARIVTATGALETIPCDVIAVSGGANPNIQLTTHLGGRPQWQEDIAAFIPSSYPKSVAAAGSAAGTFALADCLSEGARAGAAAASASGFEPKPTAIPDVASEATGISAFWHVVGNRHKAFVDFQNDVTVTDIVLADREGFNAVEHLKRYTTLGMATDQGRTSNVNGLAILASVTAKTIAQTGVTTARPPYVPVALGAFAGDHRGKHFKPTRLAPSHAWAQEQGAVFVESGLWLRAQYYPRPGETDWLTTVNREVNSVRSAVGVCDVSTLGKIEIQGSDAAAFLDRLYINLISSLPIGRARYGVMLREDGFVLDDGTVARFADDRFFITTTTANAAKVYQHLEFCHQWLFPDLDVQIVPVTDHWAQYAIAGPRARQLLSSVVDVPENVANDALPYMGVAELTVMNGIPARIYRLSFSGELAYEIGISARHGDALIRTLMRKGEPLGVTPYGTEALGVMRVEKGHVGGAEINGTTTAADLGLARMASKKKDYIGRILAERPGLTDPARPQLAGFKPVVRDARLRSGAHFLSVGAEATAANDLGYMTSVAFSPSLGHWIGLGFLANAEIRVGDVVRAYDPVRQGDTPVEVVSASFVDPEGSRLRG